MTNTEDKPLEFMMLGDLMGIYSGAQVGFIPAHLKPRLTFRSFRGYQYTSRNDTERIRRSEIDVYFDGTVIGRVLLYYCGGSVVCSTYAIEGMDRWNAEQLSRQGYNPFEETESDENCFHPTFNTLSELLLHHLARDI